MLQKHQGQPEVLAELDVDSIVEQQQEDYILDFYSDAQRTSLVLYRHLQPTYEYAGYLSQVKYFPYGKLISRFRSGCHGLLVDTGRFGREEEQLSRDQRLCPVCHAYCVENEQHFLFDCPAYAHIREKHPLLFSHPAASVATFFATEKPGLLGRHLNKCMSHRQFLLKQAPSINTASCLRAWTKQHRLMKSLDKLERVRLFIVLAPTTMISPAISWCSIMNAKNI